MVFDILFLLASVAFGWGFALASYRLFARRYGWPMGELQSDTPLVPVLLGVFAMVIAGLFAAARAEYGGWWIFATGLLWAFFWIGFMRVGSQMSLFLAPLATLLLVLGWIGIRTPQDLAELARRVRYGTEVTRPAASERDPFTRTRPSAATRREDPEFVRR
ncbi:MAG: hypothetical protein R3D27_02575 [Hyphomicrobiaceae bacterium]